MNSREVIRLVEKDGWVLHHIRGSHHHFRHPIKPGIVTVQHPRKDIPPGTLNSILKQAGLKGGL
ncbi:MAG: type II toxin-antitoxin system HicA family toxin [Phycisphaerales bacterium]